MPQIQVFLPNYPMGRGISLESLYCLPRISSSQIFLLAFKLSYSLPKPWLCRKGKFFPDPLRIPDPPFQKAKHDNYIETHWPGKSHLYGHIMHSDYGHMTRQVSSANISASFHSRPRKGCECYGYYPCWNYLCCVAWSTN